MTLMQAIAKMEGFLADPQNIPTRHNNPGDICTGQFANAHGAIPGAPDPHYPHNGPSRYAVFNSPQMGWMALRTLLRDHYCGMTVAGLIGKYAPATENNTQKYIDNVCTWTGLKATDLVTMENIG